ncbi:retroviral-like aspartic protease family protein [Fortiea sp. LEGE XX443]|uniref:retropepsin-like aspartic protease family protein n=1 Tax=Fortiea sp. LEGE XX443 TaxID=1828611 RepID=UPI001881DB14|nr:retropepsin-like aspartic protease [Fortiea sp. LEGE XX443]MBE9008423.1 retroviral-like aspartic protease family protein [Fortiea sp. LEGE XX443]
MNCAWKRVITNVNLALIAVMPTLIFLALTHRATAEDMGTCFMINSSGTTVELTKLCSGTNRTKTSGQQRVFRVPIKRHFGRTPVIDVTFNNQNTFEMIFDTGANGTLITQAMANTLQIKPTGTLHAQIADGSQVQFPTGKIKSIAAGGIIANNVEVAIASKAGIGLLGHDFFGNYDIKILEKEVEFHPR